MEELLHMLPVQVLQVNLCPLLKKKLLKAREHLTYFLHFPDWQSLVEDQQRGGRLCMPGSASMASSDLVSSITGHVNGPTNTTPNRSLLTPKPRPETTSPPAGRELVPGCLAYISRCKGFLQELQSSSLNHGEATPMMPTTQPGASGFAGVLNRISIPFNVCDEHHTVLGGPIRYGSLVPHNQYLKISPQSKSRHNWSLD